MPCPLNFHYDGVFTLESALLVYRTSANRYFASAHSVTHPKEAGEAPRLEPGVGVTGPFLTDLTAKLRPASPPELLPAGVLSITPDELVWWIPARRRPLFFDENGDGRQFNGRGFPHPALLFRTRGQKLWVTALADNERPTLDTPLFHAPYWNLSETFHVCLGSAMLPREMTTLAERIEGWEHAFFGSRFTHPHYARGTAHPEGLLGLWRDLADSPGPFPVEWLAPSRHRLRALFER